MGLSRVREVKDDKKPEGGGVGPWDAHLGLLAGA